MKLNPRLSRPAVELVKRFETFEPIARPAAHGGWIIGYGHTRTAREGATVSREDAEALLLYDLSAAADLVDATVRTPLNASQFEALTAFAFGVGPETFRRSGALAQVNAGAYIEAADEIGRSRVAGRDAGPQVEDALVRRRAAEKAHFLSLPVGTEASASPLPHPPVGTGSSGASATLTAANTVQARLREIIPDTREPSPAARTAPATAPAREQLHPVAALLHEAETRHGFSATSIATPFGVAAPLLAAGGLVGVAEPPPPPFANDHGPILVDPLSEEGLDPAPEAERDAHERSPHEMAAPRTRVVEAKTAGGVLRYLPHLVGLVGLLLFAGAVAAILKGRPDLPSLAVGLVGAVVMAGALYRLLDPPRR